MSYSSGLAWSLISSSEMMAFVMSSSNMRFDAMREPISVRIGVSSRSVTSALRTVRQARSAPATLRSAFIDSVAPTVDSFRYSRTSVNHAMGLAPL